MGGLKADFVWNIALERMESYSKLGVKQEMPWYPSQFTGMSYNNAEMISPSVPSWESTAQFTQTSNNYDNGFMNRQGSTLSNSSPRITPAYANQNLSGNFSTNYDFTEISYSAPYEKFGGFYPTYGYQATNYYSAPMYENNSCRYGSSNFPRFVYLL